MNEHDTNCLMNLFEIIGNPYIKHTAQEMLRRYNKVLQENKKLKQWDKNKDTRNSRQRVEISRLLKENKELKSLLEKQSKINAADHKYASLKEDEVIELTEQLKQKDEVINKVIKMLEINIEIVKEQPSNDKLADKFIIESYNSLLEILQKYKGDNK